MLLAESQKEPPGSIVYATDSDIVGVQAETGNVFLNSALDREVCIIRIYIYISI